MTVTGAGPECGAAGARQRISVDDTKSTLDGDRAVPKRHSAQGVKCAPRTSMRPPPESGEEEGVAPSTSTGWMKRKGRVLVRHPLSLTSSTWFGFEG